jgi:hypothetical protein
MMSDRAINLMNDLERVFLAAAIRHLQHQEKPKIEQARECIALAERVRGLKQCCNTH